MSSYVPLHAHSVFSIRDSIAKIDEIVKRASDLKLPAYGLTDHGTMGGILSFYKESKQNDIKPILGSEVYVATRTRTQKTKGIDSYYHLTFLAMNNTGWKNLSTMVSEAYEADNFYYKPRIDRELLRKYNEGIICLSGCVSGNLIKSIMNQQDIHFDNEDNTDGVKKAECVDHNHALDETDVIDETPEDVVRWHQKVFGDRYYIEVQNHNMGIDDEINDRLFELAKEFNIKTVATGDTHFVYEDDVKAHDIMLAIRGNFSIHDTEKMNKYKYSGDGYQILSYEELVDRFPGRSDAVDNTLEVADRCNVEFDLDNFKLPHVIDIKEEDNVFRQQVYDGLKRRFGANVPSDIIDRANEEIETIIQMTYPSYFMIVADYVEWCKNNNIPVGPGRGSAAGSLVSYAMNITDVNPLEYGLSFSRFLNKGRSSTPMIDFDDYPYAEWLMKKQQNKV